MGGSALLSRSAHVAEQWQKNLAPLLHRATNINLELRPGNMAIDHEVTLNEEREHEQARKVELTLPPPRRALMDREGDRNHLLRPPLPAVTRSVTTKASLTLCQAKVPIIAPRATLTTSHASLARSV